MWTIRQSEIVWRLSLMFLSGQSTLAFWVSTAKENNNLTSVMEARRRRRLLDFKKPTGAETSYKLHLKKVELYQGELLMDSDPTQYSSEEKWQWGMERRPTLWSIVLIVLLEFAVRLGQRARAILCRESLSLLLNSMDSWWFNNHKKPSH